MPRQVRIYDYALGIGTHGMGECPHSILSVWIRGSHNHYTNNLQSIRVTDIACHLSCPHCGFAIAINGSPSKSINNHATHRIGDFVTNFCGISQSISGSHNSEVN